VGLKDEGYDSGIKQRLQRGPKGEKGEMERLKSEATFGGEPMESSIHYSYN